MSHQIALVIEPQDGNKVTATMMMMGRDMPLQGELVDNTLVLKGMKPEGGATESPTNGPACMLRRHRKAPNRSPSRFKTTARLPAR